jgi:hypothetical protein
VSPPGSSDEFDHGVERDRPAALVEGVTLTRVIGREPCGAPPGLLLLQFASFFGSRRAQRSCIRSARSGRSLQCPSITSPESVAARGPILPTLGIAGSRQLSRLDRSRCQHGGRQPVTPSLILCMLSFGKVNGAIERGEMRMLAGSVPRASCRRRSVAPTNPARAASKLRSAIPPASPRSGSGARFGFDEPASLFENRTISSSTWPGSHQLDHAC